MALPVATALIDGVHVKTYDYSDLGSGLAITLAGSSTFGDGSSISTWEWSILATDPDLEGGIPESSTVATGTHGDFTDGKASVQNPSITLDVAGGYCFSLRTENNLGQWSDPDEDDDGDYQAIVYIKTPGGVKQPPANQKRYHDDMNQGLQTLEDLALNPVTAPGTRVAVFDKVVPSGTVETTSSTFAAMDSNLTVTSIYIPVSGTYTARLYGHVMNLGFTSHQLARFRVNVDSGSQYFGGDPTLSNYGWDVMSHDTDGEWGTVAMEDEVTLTAGVHDFSLEWARIDTGGASGTVRANVSSAYTLVLEAVTGSGAGGTIVVEDVLTSDVELPSGSPGTLTDIFTLPVTVSGPDDLVVIRGSMVVRPLSNSSAEHEVHFFLYDDTTYLDRQFFRKWLSALVYQYDAYTFSLPFAVTGLSAGAHTLKVKGQVATSAVGFRVFGAIYSSWAHAILYRGGQVPVQQGGTLVLDKPKALNFLGAAVEDNDGVVDIHLGSTVPGVLDIDDAYPASSVVLDTTDTYKQIYPGATARTYTTETGGLHRVDLAFQVLLSNDSSFDNFQFKVELDDGVNPAIVVGNDDSWIYRKYTGGANAYIPLHFQGPAELVAGTYDIKAYGKRVGSASTNVTVPSTHRSVQVSIESVSASGAGGEIVGYLEKASASDEVTATYPTYVEPTYSSATFWDLDFTVADDEQVVIEFEGQVRSVSTGRSICVFRLLLDDTTQLGGYIICTSLANYDYGNFTITRRTDALTGGTHNIKVETCHGSGSASNYQLQVSSLIIRQMRGGLVPVQEDGTTKVSTPAALNFVGAASVTNIAGTAEVEVAGGGLTTYTYPDLTQWEVTTGPADYSGNNGTVFRAGDTLYVMEGTSVYSAPVTSPTSWSSASISTSGGGTWPDSGVGPVFVDATNEKVYVYGGRDSGGANSSIFSANFSDLSDWTYEAALPGARAYLGLVVSEDGTIWLVGGTTTPPTASTGALWSAPVSDPANVSAVTTFGSFGKSAGSLFVVDDYFYVADANGNIYHAPLADPSQIADSGMNLAYSAWSEYMQPHVVYSYLWHLGRTPTDGIIYCTDVRELKGSSTGSWRTMAHRLYSDPPTNSNQTSMAGGWFYDQDGRLYLPTSDKTVTIRSKLVQASTPYPINEGEYHHINGSALNGGLAPLWPHMRYQALWWNTWPRPINSTPLAVSGGATSTQWRYLDAVNLPTGAAAPEAVWQFDGSASELIDRTGNGHDLTVEGGSVSHTVAEGITGFSNNNAFRLLVGSQAAMHTTGAFTVVALAAVEPDSTAIFLMTNSPGATEAQNVNYQTSVNSGRFFRLGHEYGAGNYVTVDLDAAPVFGTVQHFVMTRSEDGLTYTCYLDGELVGTGSLSNAPTGGADSVVYLMGAGGAVLSNLYVGSMFCMLFSLEEWTSSQAQESYRYCKRNAASLSSPVPLLSEGVLVEGRPLTVDYGSGFTVASTDGDVSVDYDGLIYRVEDDFTDSLLHSRWTDESAGTCTVVEGASGLVMTRPNSENQPAVITMAAPALMSKRDWAVEVHYKLEYTGTPGSTIASYLSVSGLGGGASKIMSILFFRDNATSSSYIMSDSGGNSGILSLSSGADDLWLRMRKFGDEIRTDYHEGLYTDDVNGDGLWVEYDGNRVWYTTPKSASWNYPTAYLKIQLMLHGWTSNPGGQLTVRKFKLEIY